MNKIHIIMRHEWAQKRRSSTLGLLFIAMQVLLLVALLTAWSQYTLTSDQQNQAQALVEKQWNEQPDRHPHRVAHFGHFTFRPPSALSFFDNGVNHFVGSSIFIEAHRQNSANFANDDLSDSLLRFADLSVANILLLFWPLLLIAIAFNTIAAERQSGTLRQLLSINISFNQLILGKGLCYTLISLAFIAPSFIASLILLTASDISLSADNLLRIGSLFGLYMAYCLLWIIVTMLVSSIVNAPRHALTVLVSIWFIFTILTPRVITDLAQTQYPQLKRNAFDAIVKQKVSQIGDSHNPDDPHFNEFKAKLLVEYQVDSIEQLPVNYKALVIQEGERISSEIFADLYRQQLKQLQKQQDFISNFYWLNPYLLTKDLSMAISGSDAWHFYHFEMQAEQHRFGRISKLNTIHAEHIDAEHDRGSTADASHWQSFNAFSYQSPTLKQAFEHFELLWLHALFIIVLGGFIFNNQHVNRRVYALA